MNLRFGFFGLACVSLILLRPISAWCDTGREVALKSQQVHFGYDTLTAQAEMSIRRSGSVSVRSLNISLIEKGPGEYDLGRIDISAPGSIAGTVLLSWSNDRGDDQQWLRAANSNNTLRIAGRGRKATFVNSDFTFEDLLKWQIDGYRYELLGEARCPPGSCTRVRAIPLSGRSGYGQLLVDYDSLNRISQIQYFRSGSDQVWKVLNLLNYKKVGRSWQPGSSEMRDLESASVSHIEWSAYTAGAALDATLFQPN